MTDTSIAVYTMNPAEDEIKFGNELTEGMWVLPERPNDRTAYGGNEDARIRAQRSGKSPGSGKSAAITTRAAPGSSSSLSGWTDTRRCAGAPSRTPGSSGKKETVNDADTEAETTGEPS